MTNPRTVPEVLRAAADLIGPEGAWTQRHYARDANGKPVGPTTDRAVCWCAEGAVKRVAGPGRLQTESLRALGHTVSAPVWIFNDRIPTTKADVLAAMRKAAKRAEAAQQ